MSRKLARSLLLSVLVAAVAAALVWRDRLDIEALRV